MVNKVKFIQRLFIWCPITFVFAVIFFFRIFIITRKNYFGSDIWKTQEVFY